MWRRSLSSLARTTQASRHPRTCSFRAWTRLQHQQHHHGQRAFSDNLLGHSPMAQGTPRANPKANAKEGGEESSSSTTIRIPTQQDVSIAGGVWNPTSAKRDKLTELKVELTKDQYTLDDAATEEQIWDLQLADGVQWIVHTVDHQTRLVASSTAASSVQPTKDDHDTIMLDDVTLPHAMDPTQWDVEPTLVNVEAWLKQQEESIQSTIPGGQLNQEQWTTYLTEACQQLDESLATLPPARYLRHIRDFYQLSSEQTKEGLVDQGLQEEMVASDDQTVLASAGNKLLARYRLQLTRATCEHLKESWGTLTTLTDEALDRLAVKTEGGGEDGSTTTTTSDNASPAEGAITSLPLDKVNQVLRASLMGNAVDRVDAWWDLLDKEGGGLLEKTEMEQVCTSTVTSVQSAILSLFEEALEACPVRGRGGEEEPPATTSDDENTNTKNSPPSQPGWLERRREAKAKKRLLKTFQKATDKHFEDEVEMPHRLRCLYAWAEKVHQNNNIDSVLIEASGWSGRKRYVELQPKISLPEFRQVQQVHLTHLDRIGWEITKSFREDLWVEQGKGRQDAELRRDCLAFLLIVSVIDYGIIIL